LSEGILLEGLCPGDYVQGVIPYIRICQRGRGVRKTDWGLEMLRMALCQRFLNIGCYANVGALQTKVLRPIRCQSLGSKMHRNTSIAAAPSRTNRGAYSAPDPYVNLWGEAGE